MRSLLALVVCSVLAAVAGVVAIHHLPDAAVGQAEAAGVRVTVRDEVRSVAFDGRALPLAVLRGTLSTRVGAPLDRRRLAGDRAALLAALTARGHLAARVGDAQVVFGAGGGAYVTYAVEPGPRFRVRSITVPGLEPRTLGAVVPLAVGDDVLPARLERSRQAVADYLARRGPARAPVVRTTVDLDTATADIVIAAP